MEKKIHERRVVFCLQTHTPLCRSSTSPRKQWRCVTHSIPPGTRRSSSMRWRFLVTLRWRWLLRLMLWWSFTIRIHMWVFKAYEYICLTNVFLYFFLAEAGLKLNKCFKCPGCWRVHGPLCVPAFPDFLPTSGLVPNLPREQERWRAAGCLPAHTQRKGQRSNFYPQHHHNFINICLSSTFLVFIVLFPLLFVWTFKNACC